MTNNQETSRIVSVDILRGLTILLMIFVNDLAGTASPPAWLSHVDAQADSMTVADWVFPSFLFVCGISIPLALAHAQRLRRAWYAQAFHIAMRTISLLVMGVLLLNADNFGEPWRAGLWQFAMVACLLVGWLDWPKSLRVSESSQRSVRIAGMIGLAILAAVFRNKSGAWFQSEWWGILGLIGWAYLAATLATLMSRRHLGTLVGFASLFMMLYIAQQNEWLEKLEGRALPEQLDFVRDHTVGALKTLNGWVDLGTALGSHVSLVMLGAVLGVWIQGNQERGWWKTIGGALAMASLLAIAALLLDSPYGINKIRATPAWCLWSAAIAVVLWSFIALVVDLGRVSWGTNLIGWVGANPLLAYLLHPLAIYALVLLKLNFYDQWGALGGWQAMARSLAMAATIGLITAVSTRVGWRIRL